MPKRFISNMPKRIRHPFFLTQADGTNRSRGFFIAVHAGAGLHARADPPDAAHVALTEARITNFMLQETYLLRHGGMIDSD